MKIHRSLLCRLLLVASTGMLAACPEQVRPPDQASRAKVAFMQDGEAVIAYQVESDSPGPSGAASAVTIRVQRYSDAAVAVTRSDDLSVALPADIGTRIPFPSHALAADASGAALSVHTTGRHSVLHAAATGGFRACRSPSPAAIPWDCAMLQGTEAEREVAVAMNGLGGALALIAREDPAGYSDARTLQAVALTPSGAWSAPQTIADSIASRSSPQVHGYFGSEAAVAFAASGVGFALYRDRLEKLVARRYAAASDQWEAPLQVVPDAPYEPVSDARLVMHPAASGAAAMVVWAGHGIHAARYVDGAVPGWFPTATVPGSDGVRSIDAAMAANGEVLLVWRSGTRILASRHAGGAWSATPQEIGTAPDDPGPLRVAVDAQGNGVAVWRVRTGLTAASLTLANGWQAPSLLGEVTEGVARDDYSVAMDDQGRGLMVWIRNSGNEAAKGTELAWQRVGPFTLQLSAPAYVFAGDSFELTVKVATAQPVASTIELGSTFSSSVLSLPPSVTLPANEREVRVTVPTGAGDPRATGRIRASANGIGQSVDVALMPEPVLQAQLAPAALAGGQSSVLTVSATEPFPVPLTVTLTSDSAVAPVPASLVIPALAAGARTTIVTATTLAALDVSIVARTRASRAPVQLRVEPTPGGALFLDVAVAGNGRVTSSPAGIDCGSDCSEGYAIATRVALTATPAAGARFVEWTGDPDCLDGEVRMDAARTCNAIFVASGIGWQQYATGLDPNGAALQKPALALDASHAAVLAYSERGSNGVARIVLRRTLAIQSGSWQPLGDPLGGGGTDAAQPALAIDAEGNVLVAWSEGNGVRQNIYLVRYRAATQAFEPVGSFGSLNFTVNSRATQPALALRASGLPVLAWIEDGRPVLKLFDGTAWVAHAAGTGPAVANSVDRLRLSLLDDGTPLLAWLNSAGTGTVSVARGDASGWLALGGPLSGPDPASQPDMRDLGLGVDAGGQPLVAWVQGGDLAYATYARVYQAGNWQQFGATRPLSSNAAGIVSFAFVRDPGHQPLIVTIESQAAGPTLRWTRYITTGWVDQGAAATNVALLHELSLAMPRGNASFDSPVVAGSRVTSVVSTEVAAWRYFP